jgi:hypothetical protein
MYEQDLLVDLVLVLGDRRPWRHVLGPHEDIVSAGRLRPNFQEHVPTVGEVPLLALATAHDTRCQVGVDRLLRLNWGADAGDPNGHD